MRSMAPERVTITVKSDLGEDGPLTVSDALRQVIDFFDLLSAAQGENGQVVSWRLVSMSKNSPLVATAEPFSDVPGVDIGPIAHRARVAVQSALEEITSEAGVPSWMDAPARDKVRAILSRNTNGIGRTDIKMDNKSPVIMIVPRLANRGLATLVRAEAEIAAREPDLSRSEFGSVEGNVADATTYRRQPALRLRERISGSEVLCVLSDELAKKAGAHKWQEVWEGARVIVWGEVQFNRKGTIISIRADDIIEVAPRDLTYADIADPNFTAGLEPVEYLMRDADVG